MDAAVGLKNLCIVDEADWLKIKENMENHALLMIE
jgi:hypothetical protein